MVKNGDQDVPVVAKPYVLEHFVIKNTSLKIDFTCFAGVLGHLNQY